MDVLLDIILRLFPIAVGVIVLNALLAQAYKLSGGRWRDLALAYPMPEGRGLPEPLAVRWFARVDLSAGENDPRRQTWWIVARVYPDGMAIAMPPLTPIDYPPIFIPLSDLHAERRGSGANTINPPRTPNLTVTIDDTLAAALAAISAGATATSAN